MIYAEAIKKLRSKMILTQTEIAELLGVTFGMLMNGNLENMSQR